MTIARGVILQASYRVVSRRDGRRHPVVALWPVALREKLRHALVHDNIRKVEDWAARCGVGFADWPDAPVDPFFNVNTPADVATANRIAAQSPDL